MEASGPQPRFDEVHLRRALEFIGDREPLGRKQLAEQLGVGEGSVRTILKRLKNKGLIISSPQGHVLTEDGENELKRMRRKFVQLDAGNLTVGKIDVATIVRGAAKKIREGIEQRDEAIKAGAEGATVLISENSEIRLPNGSRGIDEKIVTKINDFFRPKAGDVVVLGTGGSRDEAERGASAAAASLLESKDVAKEQRS